MPASSFYVFVASVAIAVFFLVWWMLQENGDETPWIPAGLAGSTVLAMAVVMREVIMRRVRNRAVQGNLLDRTLSGVNHVAIERPEKLSVGRNATILRELREKSEAANVLNNLPGAHREVFELCESYLSVNSRELANVGNGSPRLVPLLKGRDLAESLHKHHMLNWAETEARLLGNEAKGKNKVTEKIKLAQAALGIIESALSHYPAEPKLRESRDALDEFIAAVRVNDWIEKAKKAAFRGNLKLAIKHYNDALFFYSQHPEMSGGEAAVERIDEELKKLKQIDA